MSDHSQGRPYQLLPPEMRPKYTTVRDLRLMAKAHRDGWIEGVPPERIAEWEQNLSEILKSNPSIDVILAVSRLMLAAQRRETELYRAWVSSVLVKLAPKATTKTKVPASKKNGRSRPSKAQ